MSNDAWKSLKPALLICALSIVVSGFAATAAFADDGVPDPSFGGDGRVVAGVGWAGNEYPTAMAIDRQGRIVVVGVIARMMMRSVAVRINPDGSLDQSFGNKGVVALEPIADSFSGVAIDAAGRIVLAGGVVGYAPTRGIVVARLLENGQHDLSFGAEGRMTVDLDGPGMYGANSYGYDLALDGQGRILVAGEGTIEEEPQIEQEPQMVVLRVTPAGGLDNSFGEGGIAVADFSDSESIRGGGVGHAITVDPQGRILAAGTAFPSNNDEFGIAAFDAQGRPDPTLAGDGTTTIDFAPWSGEEVAHDIALDSQNRIVLAGSDGKTFALAARLLPDGRLDPSFASDGKATLPVPGAGSAAAAAIDGAGRILVAGSLTQGEIENAFLTRLAPNGSPDGSFGVGGLVREDFSAASGTGVDLSIDSAGRYLVAGKAQGRGVSGFGVARYLNEPPRQPPRCRGKRATIVGNGKPNRLRGTRGRDVIVALGGNDRIRSLGGKDLICAGNGSDVVRAGAGNDTVFGGRGNDRLFGQAGKDRLRGGRGRDVER
jgi:uncharacterized delta-60 repeat protein